MRPSALFPTRSSLAANERLAINRALKGGGIREGLWSDPEALGDSREGDLGMRLALTAGNRATSVAGDGYSDDASAP